jgi:chitinase
VYTHINFAFATIDPSTFEVTAADNNDIPLYARVTALKRQDPDLKVFIAIGGWTFNDPGPTASTFSDIASSEANQGKFIRSLISFMSDHGFDGVDLDWEYPAADDRNGRPEDFANFPKFIRNLKSALRSAGDHDGLSITLPASYWYLQHFDIKELVKDVDWFNIMSYDLHGTWDKGNKWTGAYLNAHTNLTEIQDAIDLLWRNDIDPDKVVMGVAFYGRAFTATSQQCMTPGCTYESGAESGSCSKEVGILLGSEIVDIIKEKGITPTLDKAAAVKIATWNDQWVAYDDAETLQLKLDFMRGQCMGGVMVWAGMIPTLRTLTRLLLNHPQLPTTPKTASFHKLLVKLPIVRLSRYSCKSLLRRVLSRQPINNANGRTAVKVSPNCELNDYSKDH